MTGGPEPLLVALDVATGVEALALAERLRGAVGGLKVGSRLFTSEGPDLVRGLARDGTRVFLDLKFHDIPNTVAQAVSAATSLGVWMVNVHASGGLKMMQAAVDAAHETAAAEGRTPPLVIAVTVLTSLNQAMLAETGVDRGGAGSRRPAGRTGAAGRARRRRRVTAGNGDAAPALRSGRSRLSPPGSGAARPRPARRTTSSGR